MLDRCCYTEGVCIYIYIFWLVVSTPLKDMKVNWDDDIPNMWKNRSHVPNHQPDHLVT